MSGVRNFYFDLDGVLVDACDWHFEALNRSLLKNGEKEIPYDLHLKVFNGLPTRNKLNILGIGPLAHGNIIKDKNIFFSDLMHSRCAVDQSKIELISFLKGHSYKVTCVTNSIRATAEGMLKAVGVYELFDLVVSNEDVPENKPSPCPYNFAIDKIGGNPCYSIAVEDSEKGIESAAKSKINLIWRVNCATEVNLNNYLDIFGG